MCLKNFRIYFKELRIRLNLTGLDDYHYPTYLDEDISDSTVDHIQNILGYIAVRFGEQRSIGVNVVDGLVHDDVISAYLQGNDLVDVRRFFFNNRYR